MNEGIVAIVTLALIVGSIWLGLFISYEPPTMTKDKFDNITITVQKKDYIENH